MSTTNNRTTNGAAEGWSNGSGGMAHFLGKNGNHMKAASYKNGVSEIDEIRINKDISRRARYHVERMRSKMPESYGQGFKDWNSGESRRNKEHDTRESGGKHSKKRRGGRKEKKKKAAKKRAHVQKKINPHAQDNVEIMEGPEDRERVHEVDMVDVASIPLPPVVPQEVGVLPEEEEKQSETVDRPPSVGLKPLWIGFESLADMVEKQWLPQHVLNTMESPLSPVESPLSPVVQREFWMLLEVEKKESRTVEMRPLSITSQKQLISQAVLDEMDSPQSPDMNEEARSDISCMTSPVPQDPMNIEDVEVYDQEQKKEICEPFFWNSVADVKAKPRSIFRHLLTASELSQYQLILNYEMGNAKRCYFDAIMEREERRSIHDLKMFFEYPMFIQLAEDELNQLVDEKMKMFYYWCYLWVTEGNSRFELHIKMAKMVPQISEEMTAIARAAWFERNPAQVRFW